MSYTRKKGSVGLIFVLLMICWISIFVLLLCGGITILDLWTVEKPTREGLYKAIPLLIFSLLVGLRAGTYIWKKLVLSLFGEKSLKNFFEKFGDEIETEKKD